MSKALLIKSQIDKNGGEVGKWNNFNNAPSYIQGIHTGKMLEDISAEKLGALISGIPTPWARAKLFKFAFATIAAPDPNINTEGLLQFYNMLLPLVECCSMKRMFGVTRMTWLVIQMPNHLFN